MKRQHISFFILTLLFLNACKDQELTPVIQPGVAASITSPATGSSYVFTEANAGDAFEKVTWTGADFGFAAGVEYTLQLDLAGNDFAEPVNLGTVNADSIADLTNGELNNILITKGLPDNVPGAVELRVKASVNPEVDAVYSAPISINITPFMAVVDYPKLGVPGDYQDWKPENEMTVLYSKESNKIYEGFIYFPNAGSFHKYTDGPSWDVNWGDDGNDGTLEPGGADIPLTDAGMYRLNVDINTLTHSSVKTDWGLIGSATPDGWDSDQNMTFDTDKGVLTITLDLVAGDIKFRANDAWDIEFGDNDTNGSLEYGGANIPVADAGNYTIELVLNVADYTYKITKN